MQSSFLGSGPLNQGDIDSIVEVLLRGLERRSAQCKETTKETLAPSSAEEPEALESEPPTQRSSKEE